MIMEESCIYLKTIKREGAEKEARKGFKLPLSLIYCSNPQSFTKGGSSETWTLTKQTLVDPVLPTTDTNETHCLSC